jgi:hypothetical protein
MRRFDFAIKAIQNEIYRDIGKVATKAVENKHDPTMGVRARKVLHMKEAIEILQEHQRNKAV